MPGRKQDTSNWEEISDMLTPEGRNKLGMGDTLAFMIDGEKKWFKVVKMTVKRVWIAPTILYTEDELKALKAEADEKAMQ